MSKHQSHTTDPQAAAALLAHELITTWANLAIVQRDDDRFGDDKQWRKSADARQEDRRQCWNELLHSVNDHLPDVIDHLLDVHTSMATQWQARLPHTIGLVETILRFDDSPIGRAASGLVLTSIRAALDPDDHTSAAHRQSLVSMVQVGTRKSQRAFVAALARLGGAVAAARPLERDGDLFDFSPPTAPITTPPTDPWGSPSRQEVDEAPF